jgi:hypothetical protein
MSTKIRIEAAMAAVLILAGAAAMADDMKPKAERPAAVAKDPACLARTGSRIPVNGRSCSAIGRSYTIDDIRRTGATTVGGALRLMDPSITVQR